MATTVIQCGQKADLVLDISMSGKNLLPAWDALTKVPHVHTLHMRACCLVGITRAYGPVNDTEIVKIDRFGSSLRRLEITGMSFTGKTFDRIRSLDNLSSLIVSRNRPLTDLFLHVGVFPALDNLEIEDTRLVSPQLEHLTELPVLRFLELKDCQLNDADLGRIKGHETLESMTLRNNKVSGLGMKCLRHMPALKRIDLKRNRVALDGLKFIQKQVGKQLEDIWMGDNPLNDECVHAILPMEKLIVLDLSNTKVTDAGITKLTDMKTLRHVFLEGTKVSLDTIKKMQEKLPYCYFVLPNGESLAALEWREDYD